MFKIWFLLWNKHIVWKKTACDWTSMLDIHKKNRKTRFLETEPLHALLQYIILYIRVPYIARVGKHHCIHGIQLGRTHSWWRHQMETFSALLALCAGNSPVPGEFPAQRPVTRSLIFSLICARINGWVDNGEDGDLRCYRAHYDVIVMLVLLHDISPALTLTQEIIYNPRALNTE